MRDPHVEAIYYTAAPKHEGIKYRNPPAVDWDAELAMYRLEQGQLTAWPKRQYASAQEAHYALRPELDAWEAHVDLTQGSGDLRFRYKTADLVDRDPPSPGSRVHDVPVITSASAATMTAHAVAGRAEYPTPPSFCRVDTEIVRDLLARYRQWQDGREPFASMAYAVMTRIEARAGSRQGATRHYNISGRVLNRLGDLVSRHT